MLRRGFRYYDWNLSAEDAAKKSPSASTIVEGITSYSAQKKHGVCLLYTSGLHPLVYEIVDNAIDEALAGYCDHIEVKILKGDIIQVTDNGRGIPVDIQADTGLPAVTVVYTCLLYTSRCV